MESLYIKLPGNEYSKIFYYINKSISFLKNEIPLGILLMFVTILKP